MGNDVEVVVGVLLVWFLLAVVVALVIGRGIRLADASSTAEHPLSTADLPADFRATVDPSRR
jgi:hypothetical protein